VWPDYTYAQPGCSSKADPINLLFEGIHYQTVVSAITALASRLTPPEKWFSPFNQRDQWLCDQRVPSRKQDVGLADGHGDRFHVRCWSWDGGSSTAASAHYEYLTLRRGHLVASFEAGETKIADILQGMYEVFRDEVNLGNSRTQPFCNGLATRMAP
jgi:hypothetical protein